MSQEIEIRFKVTEKEEQMLQDWLKANAKFVKSAHQEEVYFSNPENSFKFVNEEMDGLIDASDYLRVRRTEKGDSVCLKRWHKDPDRAGMYTHCDEYEYDVSEGDTAIELFLQLGYTDKTELIKDRAVYSADEFEIVIDKIKGLGTFVEVECKKEFENPKDGQKAIYSFLKSLGFEQINQQNRGYISMLWNPDYDFSEIIEL